MFNQRGKQERKKRVAVADAFGKQARQRHGSFHALMRDAAEAIPLLQTQLQELARRFDCAYEIGPLKSARRAFQKVQNKYHGDTAQLCDLCRGMLIVDDDQLKKLRRIATYFNPQGNPRTKAVDDKFSKPRKNGFRSLNISYEMQNGHIVEIMVLTRGMHNAYALTHDIYERARAINPRSDKKLQQEKENLLRQTKEIHESAVTPQLLSFRL